MMSGGESVVEAAGDSSPEWRRLSVITLIAANLIPVYGVLILGWKVFPVILLFWFENVIIGLLNALKMLFASTGRPADWIGKVILIPFFCVHYGMFTFIHGIFVLVLFGGMIHGGDPLPTPETLLEAIRAEHIGWGVLALGLSHIVSFLTNYIGKGEYKQASASSLMQQPYGRVVVMHLTLLGSGYLLTALHDPTFGLLILVGLKIILDLRGHVRERRRFSSPVKSGPAQVVS